MRGGPKDPHLAEVITKNDLGLTVRLPTDHIKVYEMELPAGATDIQFDMPVAEALWKELCRAFVPDDPLADDDIEPGPEACWSERKLRREYAALRANEQDMRRSLNKGIDELKRELDVVREERDDAVRTNDTTHEWLAAERKLSERYARTLDILLDAADPDAVLPERARRLKAAAPGVAR